MSVQAWASAGVILSVITAALVLARILGRPLRKLVKANDEFREDWYGVSARPGRDAVLGVPERLRRIEKELQPNGGASLRDGITRLEARLEDHIRSHGNAV